MIFSLLRAVQFHKINCLAAAANHLAVFHREENLETQPGTAEMGWRIDCHLPIAVKIAGVPVGMIVRNKALKHIMDILFDIG